MATLTNDITATQRVIEVTTPDGPPPGQRYRLDDELVEFAGYWNGPERRERAKAGTYQNFWVVNRGVGIAGTTAATHTSGATLTRYYPDAATAAGGVTVDNQTDPPTEVTTLVMPAATIAGDTATLAVTQAVYSLTTPLTDAQIKALPTTAVEVVPAPGAGLTIMPLKISIAVDTTEGEYTNLDAGIELNFKLDTGELAIGRLIAVQVEELLTSFAHNMAWMDGQGVNSGYSMGVEASSDKPLMLRIDNLAVDLTGGHASNSGSVTVVYTVMDL